MPLESCMILLDNSEFMRNGDYIPTRLEAQQDAANMLVGAKTQSHPESTVGVSAGTELLVSPTDDVGKILNALHGLPMHSSKPDITASVQVASLALKHRRNKNGAQRVVLFVGSPLANVDNRALAKAGRQLKKNNVAIDVVAMGELEENEEKLRELVDAANGRMEEGTERTCHLVTIPAGVLPSDVLSSSPIVHGGAGGGGGYGAGGGDYETGGSGGGGGEYGGGGFADFGGVDPNMDPELAMALRVSMEEERSRQERAAASQAQPSGSEAGGGDNNNESAGNTNEESKDTEMADANAAPAPGNTAEAGMDAGMSEEEALLQQALAMSMNENEPAAEEEENNNKEAAAKPAAVAAQMDIENDEDGAMQMALQMSIQKDEGDEKEESKDGQFQDPNYVNEVSILSIVNLYLHVVKHHLTSCLHCSFEAYGVS